MNQASTLCRASRMPPKESSATTCFRVCLVFRELLIWSVHQQTTKETSRIFLACLSLILFMRAACSWRPAHFYNPLWPVPDRGLPPPSNFKHQVSWHRVSCIGHCFSLSDLRSNDLSLDSQCLGNARRRVRVFYRWVV